MPHESQVVGWPGRTLFDADGSKIGKIEEVFADERTGRPAWATVSSGLFGRRHHFVPIEQAREVEDGVAVPVAGQLVKGAPNVDADGDLSHEDERQLYRHYGLDDGEGDETGTATADADGDGRRDRDARGDADGDGRPDRDAQVDGRRDRDARLDADGDGRSDRSEDDRSEDDRSDSSARGYAHHDERTRRDAGDDDRLGGGFDEGERQPVGDGLASAAAAAAAQRERERSGTAGVRDDERSVAGDRRDHERSGTTHARDDEHAGTTDLRDDERGPGVPPTLQADATTEALARAERERLAAEEAEHDRLAQGQAAPNAAHEPPVLDRELAQQDLSVTPAPDATTTVGRPHVDDGYTPRRDHAIDLTGGAGDAPTAGTTHDDRPDGAPGERPGSDTPDTGTAPSAGTRLRRLVRSITPSKDDHHG